MPNVVREAKSAPRSLWQLACCACGFALAPFALALFTLALFTVSANAAVVTGTHAFDAEKSHAEFSVRTLWLSSVDGKFDHVSGFLRVDEQGKVSVLAWINMDELRMGNTRYAKSLRSAEFFNVAKYHDMRFRSLPFAAELLGTGGDIRGWLTLRGQTRPVRFELAAGDCKRPLHDACVLSLRGSIDRADFGMNAHGLTVSNRVRLRLEVALAKSRNDPT